ncbi:SCO family protein [Microbulbifer yueqingensis]|uniref:Protein SCO1/2 n=1 Tax=Microbulbifer yueqingensis TaxID=658219 RepID=A0A1G9BC93_9GAMM|nr:SCO family protein [Microbulbifer yueqingensis]SDK36710.1 protein SCO1/2 [Microbulbifer yueqingensis]
MRVLRSLSPLVFLLALTAAQAEPRAADSPQQRILDQVAFDQRIGQSLPPSAAFRDAQGRVVELARLADGRPLLLVLAWFDCPHLCPTLLDQLAAATAALPFPATDYRVAVVNIDPRAGAPSGAALARRLARRHGEPLSGWYFLSGSAGGIRALADAVGFRYVYDAERDTYAHPAGLVVVAPGGTVNSYLLRLDALAPDLRLALVDAGRGRLGSPVDQLLLRCYQFDPHSGRYTLAVTRLLQVFGSLFVLGLAAYLLGLKRRRSP